MPDPSPTSGIETPPSTGRVARRAPDVRQSRDLRAVALEGAAVAPLLRSAALLADVVLAVLLARWGGPSVVGDVALVLAVVGIIVLIGGLQIETQAARSGDPDWCAAAAPWALLAGVVSAASVAGVGTVFALGSRLPISAPMFAAVPMAAVQPLLGWTRGTLATEGSVAWPAFLPAARSFLRLAALGMIGLALQGQPPTPLLVVLLFSVVELFLCAAGLTRVSGHLRARSRRSPARLIELLRSHAALLVSSAAWMAMLRVDVVIVSVLVGNEAAGRYLTAVRLGEIPVELFGAAMFMFMPAGAMVYGRRGFQHLYRYVTRAVAVPLVPLVVFVGVWGDQVVRWVFGRSFVLPISVYVFTAFGLLAHTLSGPSGATLIVKRRHHALLIASMAVLCFNVMANLAFVRLWGAIGAAAASALSLALVNVLYLWFGRSDIGVTVRSWRYPVWVACATASIALVQVCVRALTHEPSPLAAGMAGILGIVTALVAARLSPTTWRAFRGMLRTLVRRRSKEARFE